MAVQGLLETAGWLADATEARGMRCMRLDGGSCAEAAVQLAVSKARLLDSCLHLRTCPSDPLLVRALPPAFLSLSWLDSHGSGLPGFANALCCCLPP